MFSIEKSFVNCSKCKLFGEPSCILETNCEDDLSKVEVIFIAENPGKVEVVTGKPLTGQAGSKVFRPEFEKYSLDKVPYLLTNVVLCQTVVNGKTVNPDDETIMLCRENCFNIIKLCQPKLIVLMGSSPMKAFGISKTGITKRRGRFYKWNDYDVFLTFHPSYVLRRGGYDPSFDNDFKTIAEYLGNQNFEIQNVEDMIGNDNQLVTSETGPHYYKVPDKYYTKEYRLVDVQYSSRIKKVIYIFRNSKNEKEYFLYGNTNYYYYKPKDNIPKKKIMPYSDLLQYKTDYDNVKNNLSNLSKLYEADVAIDVKHAIDYFLKSEGECNTDDYNIMFFDIEIGEMTTEFPDPKEVKYPVVLITSIYHKKTVTYFLWKDRSDWKRFEDLKYNTKLKLFDDEKSLLRSFCSDFRKQDPDFLSGWNNIAFDVQYIYNRMTKLGLNPASLCSKYNDFYINSVYGVCSIPGNIIVDQYILYRDFTHEGRENYKLGTIASIELGGDTKEHLPTSIYKMYSDYPELYIKYNIKDVSLCERLENELGHIKLLVEFQKICHTTIKSALSTFGQVDSCVISHLKKKNLSFCNANRNTPKTTYPGAYVMDCVPGIRDWITDFDFSSLYPSLIITYNIGPNTIVAKFKNDQDTYPYLYERNSEKVKTKKFDVICNISTKPVVKQMSFDEILEMQNSRNLICTINGCFYKSHNEESSIYADILGFLLEARKKYKRKMFDATEQKNEKEITFYDTRQLAYKILANAHYGVIGNKIFRFFDVDNASAITLSGQEALKTSCIHANAYLKSLNNSTKLEKPKSLSFEELFGEFKREFPYVVGGDTDSIFCCFEKFKTRTLKSIKRYCDKTQNYLNNNVLIDLVKIHNVNPEKTRLNLKNELICKRGLFLAKKRYALWNIRREEKDVDKIICMGLETKRSDYPSATKTFLNNLINIILKSDKISLLKLYEFINSSEKDFVNMIKSGDKRVAKPVTYGRKLSEYKSIPKGVKGMENWNHIVAKEHFVGSKGYLFDIRGFDYESAPKNVQENYDKFIKDSSQLDVIAVPVEEDYLPKYFIPDLKSMLQFCFTNRWKLLLSPLIKIEEEKSIETF